MEQHTTTTISDRPTLHSYCVHACRRRSSMPPHGTWICTDFVASAAAKKRNGVRECAAGLCGGSRGKDEDADTARFAP
eukprot:4863044-Prymnesium_polylepis.2